MRWGKSDLVDVYIDDVATLAAVPAEAAASPLWDSHLLERVDQFYLEKRVLQSVHKATDRVLRGGRLWGAEVDGLRGEVGAPALRRSGVLCPACCGSP